MASMDSSSLAPPVGPETVGGGSGSTSVLPLWLRHSTLCCLRVCLCKGGPYESFIRFSLKLTNLFENFRREYVFPSNPPPALSPPILLMPDTSLPTLCVAVVFNSLNTLSAVSIARV